jgi:hypothetical protein
VDLNELKNRAKDLLADLTEPRPEQDERSARDPADDPAARTDRLDDPLARPAEDGPTGRHQDEPTPSTSGARAAELPADRQDTVAHQDTAAHQNTFARQDTGARQDTVAHHGQPVPEGGVPPADLRDDRIDPPVAGVAPGATPAAAPVPDVEQGRHHYRDEGDTASTAGTDDEGRERLVSVDRARSYSARWDAVKGEFVDEPRQAVAKADALVGELLDELGRLFNNQRRGIEQGLDNDDASTEDLRLALRRYRSFFDRLLSV